MYFYFSEEAFSKMVGNDNWDNKVFEVTQEGSQPWEGQVKVWKRSSGHHGRRDKGPSPGQWAEGDVIKMKYCVDTGKNLKQMK